MQCPSCRAKLPINFAKDVCPRCGRVLKGAGAEPSSPSLKVDLGKEAWRPRRLWTGLLDAMELLFAPRVAWERAAGDQDVFLGRRSPPAVVSLVLGFCGAVTTALVMHFVGHRYGVGEYVATRQWAWIMVAVVPAMWLAAAFAAFYVGRQVAQAMLPPIADDPMKTRQNASRVAVLSAVPTLCMSGAAVLWLVPDVGPALALLAAVYAMHSTLVGIWRGGGMILDLDQKGRLKLLFTLAIPLTLLYTLCGAGGLVLLILNDA